MEKHLPELDPEVAEIMVCHSAAYGIDRPLSNATEEGDPATERIHSPHCLRELHLQSSFRCPRLAHVKQVLRRISRS